MNPPPGAPPARLSLLPPFPPSLPFFLPLPPRPFLSPPGAATAEEEEEEEEEHGESGAGPQPRTAARAQIQRYEAAAAIALAAAPSAGRAARPRRGPAPRQPFSGGRAPPADKMSFSAAPAASPGSPFARWIHPQPARPQRCRSPGAGGGGPRGGLGPAAAFPRPAAGTPGRARLTFPRAAAGTGGTPRGSEGNQGWWVPSPGAGRGCVRGPGAGM